MEQEGARLKSQRRQDCTKVTGIQQPANCTIQPSDTLIQLDYIIKHKIAFSIGSTPTSSL